MIRLRTLGAVDLKDSEGCELRPLLNQPKRLALLAYLALAGSSGLRRRDTVVALFWPELERWVEEERIALRRRAAASAWALADGYRVAGDRGDAAALARRAAGFAPEDEGALARLIAFLDDLGDRAGALGAYDEFARRLKQEYDAEPAPETQALIRSVRERTAAGFPTRAAEPSVAAAEVVAAPAPRAHRTLVYLAIGGVVALIGYLAAFANRRPPFDPERATVVVLPLEDLSGDSKQAYLASGVTKPSITDLAQRWGLPPINRRTLNA